MDDARIEEIRREVLAAIRAPAASSRETASLEARVAALEDAVRALPGPSLAGAVPSHAAAFAPPKHPALRLLEAVVGGGDRCELEPDKPCVQSGRCRTFGH